MEQQLKHINFYNHALINGYANGFIKDDDLKLSFNQKDNRAYYITKMFDTKDDDMTYNRLFIDIDYTNSKLVTVITVTNETHVYINDELIELNTYLNNNLVSGQDKEEVLTALNHKRYVNTTDILLHDIVGRYVYVYIAVIPTGDCASKLNGLRLEYPKYSFNQYFPEIYQDNETFDKFIAIFQSLYLDLEKEVDSLPKMLDYQTTDEKSLRTLSSWLGIMDDNHIFTSQQLKYIIKNIDIFQRKKGTRLAVSEIIELVTGVKPVIIEQFKWNNSTMTAAKKEMYATLYGGNVFDFCVVLDYTKLSRPPIEDKILENIVKQFTMIGTNFKLVCLQDCNYADTYCYLGMNSRLSTPEVASVDQAVLGGHIVI